MRGNYIMDDSLLTAGVKKHAEYGLPRMCYFALRHKDIQRRSSFSSVSGLIANFANQKSF
jgi:hypothetical protein